MVDMCDGVFINYPRIALNESVYGGLNLFARSKGCSGCTRFDVQHSIAALPWHDQGVEQVF